MKRREFFRSALRLGWIVGTPAVAQAANRPRVATSRGLSQDLAFNVDSLVKARYISPEKGAEIKAAWANGPVSDFIHHGLHWASPKGAGSSQSLPAMRPYILDRNIPPPLTFYEVTSLIAPRALAVGQAVGERRPMEEENCAAVSEVYRSLNASERVKYVWYPGDHDFPPHVRKEAVEWFRHFLQ